jgi:PPP family 3-phenylpropionic acid transporter
MRDIRAQYFFTFGILGAVVPYVSMFFKSAGLTDPQVGQAFAIWSVAGILSPVLVAWAADTRMDPRRLVMACAAGGGAALLALSQATSVATVFAAWTAYCFVSTPLLPLMDGIYFAEERSRVAAGAKPRAYHRVRVWGTVGYILPTAILFVPLRGGLAVGWALASGAGFAAMTILLATRMVDPHADARSQSPAIRPRAQAPTIHAARVLLRPNVLVFCAVLFLGQMVSNTIAAFVPVDMKVRLGLKSEWVAVIQLVGVVAEVPLILLAGRMVQRFGIKGMMLIGMATAASRLGLIALVGTVEVHIATQLVHGLMVVTLGVVPQPFLNSQAEDHFRHSVQGLFVTVMGFGKVAGSLSSGEIARHGTATAFLYAGGLATAATLIAFFFFRSPNRPQPAAVEAADLPATEAA